ncbi:MAG TPA: nucleotide exchange factor GrpE [Planctomycetota bacterium]|nr:nucleotide exchange factor GrpE [Planctomycetota bacterium]
MEQNQGSPESAPAESPEVRELREKAAKATEYLDLARRTKADFINYQDRVRREKAEWSQEGLEDFILDFLPALDSFTWARFEDPSAMESIRLVEHEFLRALALHHITPIQTVGAMFDPALHEAVGSVETADKPPGTVVDQVRRGWMIGDRVLRPAGVRIARAPEPGAVEGKRRAASDN